MDTTFHYIGIDVSKDFVQISTQDIHQNWVDTKIANDIKAIHNWLDKFVETFKSCPFVVFEYTGTYSCRLTHCLTSTDTSFYVLTPTQSNGFAKTMQSIAKTDKADARLLYLYGVKMKPATSVLETPVVTHRRQLFKHLALLKQEKQSYQNRLHALSFDPDANALIQQSIQQALAFYDQQVTTLEAELFKDNDDQHLSELEEKIQTIVGIGPKSAGALIAATNGFANFSNAKQVAKFLGVCPSNRQSGSSVKGKGAIPKSANTYARKCLYMAARSARKYNTACKELFDRLRAKGKPFRVAMIAVVHKLVRQAFAIVNNGRPFDNNLNCAK